MGPYFNFINKVNKPILYGDNIYAEIKHKKDFGQNYHLIHMKSCDMITFVANATKKMKKKSIDRYNLT
ncbi:MAG: hypothetical protein PWQ37_785 [Candidatus Petromonas sp.]|nr:hypothetical protein [Candidatus Petromonas sp.]